MGLWNNRFTGIVFTAFLGGLIGTVNTPLAAQESIRWGSPGVFLKQEGHGLSLGELSPQQAGSVKLQWRSTECQLEQDGSVIAYRPCNAAFTSDAWMYAVKVYDENLRQNLYFQIGLPGASGTSVRECLRIDYEGGEQQTYCTVKTPWELGISGAPRAFSQKPVRGNTQQAPSYTPSSSSSDPNSRFNVMKRCGRAFPGHLYQNHPDQYGYKSCMKMAGY